MRYALIVAMAVLYRMAVACPGQTSALLEQDCKQSCNVLNVTYTEM